MTLDELKTELAASLRDAANKLDQDATAMDRYIRAAAADFGRVRPRVLETSITLAADTAAYAMPATARRFHSGSWVDAWLAIEVWNRPSNIRPPVASIREATDGGGGRELILTPAPTQAYVNAVQAAHTVRYYAAHVVGETDADTTIMDEDKDLLITRAQAEAMKELALRGSGKPVNLRNASLGASVSNSTPAALYDALMRLFEHQAMR